MGGQIGAEFALKRIKEQLQRIKLNFAVYLLSIYPYVLQLRLNLYYAANTPICSATVIQIATVILGYNRTAKPVLQRGRFSVTKFSANSRSYCMERISSLKEVEESEIETMFRERAAAALEKLNLPAFSGSGMELARSEKEIAKCIDLAEKAEVKQELKERELAQRRAGATASEDLTAAERRKKNKKTHRKPRDAPQKAGRGSPRPSHAKNRRS
ncbi:hypothetical protein PAPHI01_0306 [Pancytospora philotis]|nr:hypothetical protein PAPHI01_0306 [Pancytospora philotis]